MDNISTNILDHLSETGPVTTRQILEHLAQIHPGTITSSLKNLEEQGQILQAWFLSGHAWQRERLLAEIRRRVPEDARPVARMAFEIKDMAEVLLTAATGGDTEAAMEAALQTASWALEYAMRLTSYLECS